MTKDPEGDVLLPWPLIELPAWPLIKDVDLLIDVDSGVVDNIFTSAFYNPPAQSIVIVFRSAKLDTYHIMHIR